MLAPALALRAGSAAAASAARRRRVVSQGPAHRGPVDGRFNRVRRHPHCGHEPGVADAVVVQPREILIDGKSAGHRQPDRVGTDDAHSVRHRRRAAHHDSRAAAAHALPGEDVTVSTSEGATILSGRVSNTNVMLRIGEIAAASMPKAQVINLLQVPGGSESQQVMLQVRFAEVNRRILMEAGLRCSSRGRISSRARPRSSSRRRPSRKTAVSDKVIFSDFLNLFFFDREARHWRRGASALEADRRFPEPGRAESDCLQRPGSQLPGRRRSSRSRSCRASRATSQSNSRSSASV